MADRKANPLDGKVALITGAARNLPAVIASELAAAGAAVAVNDVVAEEELGELVDTIRRQGGPAAMFMADVSRREQAAEMVAQAADELGTIDILVNGAGPFTITPFQALREEEWDRIMDVNLKAVYLLTQLVAPNMREKGWGRIINFSACSADHRNPSVYSLSKNAVRFLTQSMALQLAPAITVNAISPGQIAESAPVISAYDPALLERAIEHTLTGRLVTRREIAHMIVLMCTPAFDSVTGQILRMDGGWSIPR
jgi:3-oxoacyl-[acyl-carrier protein] reductase